MVDIATNDVQFAAMMAIAQTLDQPKLTDWRKFVRGELGVRLWRRQRQIMDAVARGEYEIAVKSGHGVGKTFLAATIVLWWLRSGGPGTIIVTSAPTNRQVEQLLWREIHSLWYRSPRLATIGKPLQRKVEITKNWAAYGFTTKEPERFQGWHAPRLRFLIDEANGFPDDLWQIIDSCMTGGDVQLVMMGNPIIPAGRFYRSFSDPKVCKFTVSSREHPNIISGRELIKGAVTRRWLTDYLSRYGHDEATVMARIDGLFPEGATQGLVSMQTLQRSTLVEPATLGPSVIAADVARWGDNQTVITRLDGQRLTWQRAWSKASTVETASRIKQILEDEPADFIVIDDDGIGGGVTDSLVDRGIVVEAFHGGRPALDGDRYYNRTSEAWFTIKELLELDVLALTGEYDAEQLWHQLTTRHAKSDARGRARIEQKDEYSRRTGLSSPDHADSLSMAVWQVARIWASQASRR